MVERRLPRGCVFVFDLKEYGNCKNIDYDLCHKQDNSSSSSYKKLDWKVQEINGMLYIKVQNLFIKNEKIKFTFSFEKKKDFAKVTIPGFCKYEFDYNGIIIATPEPVFNNEFCDNKRTSDTLDWREKRDMPYNKPIEMYALDYFNRNFHDCNDAVFVPLSSTDKNTCYFVALKFFDLFASKKGIRAVLLGYPLREHASLFYKTEKIKICGDENRIVIFYFELNLVLIARIAHSKDCIKVESENCLNDIKLFVIVNKPLAENKALIIIGIVVVPLFERKLIKKELFVQFPDNFDLKQILILCKDDIENERNFLDWWRSIAEYCKKYLKKCEENKEEFFKQLIGLTIMYMAEVDHCLPTLESNPQKQITTLLLNYEQLKAIYDYELKKIITGGYGSGKSIVGKEIVKNCLRKKTEIPITLYYICCNYFSLFEFDMKVFVKKIKKASNVDVICNNLYELWEEMCKTKNISEKKVFLPTLLEYLASKKNEVNFVLEEMSCELVTNEVAIELNKLFLSVLKNSLIVFIPESVEKNRELIIEGEINSIENNCFIENKLNMKVITLQKLMRSTECNTLLIGFTQELISKSKSILSLPNLDKNIALEKNTEYKLLESKDLTHGYTVNSKEDNESKSKLKGGETVEDSFKITGDKFDDIDLGLGSTSTSDLSKSESVTSFLNLDKNITSEENAKYKLLESKDPTHNYTDNSKEDDASKSKLKDGKTANNNFELTGNKFLDTDLDHMLKNVSGRNYDLDPNTHVKTSYGFKTGTIGHSIKGEKPKVIFLPFHDITEINSVKILSIVFRVLCFNELRKTVVLCSHLDEVASVAYAIKTIENYEAVIYSPHMQKYIPTYKEKSHVRKKLKKTGYNILVTDCKGFSGAESESVIVLVSPEDIYLRHVLVDAISRSNSHLIVLVLGSKDIKDKNMSLHENETIKSVLNNWSENMIQKITVQTRNDKHQLWELSGCYFYINDQTEEFLNCKFKEDFDNTKAERCLRIFTESYSMYDNAAYELTKLVKTKHMKGTNVQVQLTSTVIDEIATLIGPDWYSFGCHAGMEIEVLKNIEHDNKTAYDKALSILNKWIKINGVVRWEELKSCLEKFQKNNIIVAIEKKFGDSSIYRFDDKLTWHSWFRILSQSQSLRQTYKKAGSYRWDENRSFHRRDDTSFH
ncbi:uncharacterized protein LOC105849374 isoform X2 [Hydra vulgaris]